MVPPPFPRRGPHAAVGLLALVLAVGCATAPPAPDGDARADAATAAPATAAPAADPLEPWERRAVERLLAEADRALAEYRLTTPNDDNALDRYLEVLVLDPTETRARDGLDRIVEAYLDLAERAAVRGDAEDADRWLDLAGQIDDDHPAFAATRARVRAEAAVPRERVELAAADLEARTRSLADRLAALGTRAKEEALFVVITAPRDTWSRWIYQTMNAAPPAARLRARSEIGSPPSLELRALPSGG
jgi:hypothetical protein